MGLLDNIKNFEGTNSEDSSPQRSEQINPENILSDEEQALLNTYDKQVKDIQASKLPESIKESYLYDLKQSYDLVVEKITPKQKQLLTESVMDTSSEQNMRRIFKEELSALLKDYYLIPKNSSSTKAYIQIKDKIFSGDLTLTKK